MLRRSQSELRKKSVPRLYATLKKLSLHYKMRPIKHQVTELKIKNNGKQKKKQVTKHPQFIIKCQNVLLIK